MKRLKNIRKPRPLFSSPVPIGDKKEKKKWKVFPVIWSGLKRFAMFVGFMALATNLILLSIIAFKPQPELPKEMVLVLEFKDSIREIPQEASLSQLFPAQDPTLSEMVEAIEAAKGDDRVKGIIARMREGSYALSHIEELRNALSSFKESGKFTKIYSSSYGGFGSGLGRYYLASVFDEIWMQPMGIVTVTGIDARSPFLRGTLDILGVTPQFFQRKKYKTAYENLTAQEMSDPNREMTKRLIDDIKNILVTNIAQDRGMEEQDFVRLVDTGLFKSDEALSSGLIDHNNYPDVMLDEIKESGVFDSKNFEQGSLPLRSIAAYNSLREKPRPNSNASGMFNKQKKIPGVAVVYAVGAIMSGDSQAKTPSKIIGEVATSREIAPAILDAANDKSIETIVLRIDSPGGSPVASESILRALKTAKDKEGKNIIVSMSSTAASGGYWIAAYADEIFVLPTTITGSIGVVGGKFVLQDLWNKLGINWDGVQWGENSGMWSFNTPFSSSESERVNAMLDHVYESFIARVAEGRGMKPEDVDKIAGGRVWSGQAAIEIGLADKIGGLSDALDYAASLSGKESRNDVNIQIFPKPKTPVEQILEILNGGVYGGQISGGVNAYIFDLLKPVIKPLVVSSQPEAFMVYETLQVQ